MNRIKKAESLLTTLGCYALLITDPLDLFYLTSLELSAGSLLLVEGETTLFVDGRYKEVASHSGLIVEDVALLPEKLQRAKGPLGFDSDVMTYAHYVQWQEKKVALMPYPSPIKALRRVKEAEEIEKLTKAAELCMRGMQRVLDTLQVDITEKEVANRLEIFWKEEGGDRCAFEPIIAFGENSSKPHHRASHRRLQRGDVVLVDIDVVVEHYHSDMTRVFGFGAVDQQLKKIYAIVYEAKRHAIEGCHEGATLQEVDALARDYIVAQGYGAQFIHSLGHGVGLEIHETPSIHKNAQGVLQENEVITIEPGIYIPHLGGVRIEDTIVVQKRGAPSNLIHQFDSNEMIII